MNQALGRLIGFFIAIPITAFFCIITESIIAKHGGIILKFVYFLSLYAFAIYGIICFFDTYYPNQ